MSISPGLRSASVLLRQRTYAAERLLGPRSMALEAQFTRSVPRRGEQKTGFFQMDGGSSGREKVFNAYLAACLPTNRAVHNDRPDQAFGVSAHAHTPKVAAGV